jgi:hypothetical protein
MFKVGLRDENYLPQDIRIACTTSLQRQMTKRTGLGSVGCETRRRRPLCSAAHDEAALSLGGARRSVEVILSPSAWRAERDAPQTDDDAMWRLRHVRNLLASAPLRSGLNSAGVVVIIGRFLAGKLARVRRFERLSSTAEIRAHLRHKALI